MRTRVKAMVEQLAQEHQQELAAAGTLVDLEELTAQMGDEFGRQLCENELTSRSGRAASQVIFAPVVAGLFFPLAGRLGLPARGTVTPKILQKMVWAGSNLGSYEMAEDAMRELAGVPISLLPKQQVGSTAIDPPQIAVTAMDGGRYQRRDHFGEKGRPVREKQWREDKVGCLLSMSGDRYPSDPTPEFPAWLATSSAVAELAKMAEKQGVSDVSEPMENQATEPPDEARYPSPKLVSREVVASGADAESFGWQLAARAWQRGFPAAERQAFVADGAHANWTIQGQHFSHATPILDLMHALSYAFSAALAVPEKDVYRRLGLPLTSSHIESTIKQINRRVKGTEKFWSQLTSEAVLQLRADYLSDSAPLVSFWLRHQARQTGVNTYAQTT